MWEYALEDIPTHHLMECFKRAVKAKSDTYMVTCIEINMQWKEYHQELLRQARELPALPVASSGLPRRMTLTEWKALHNLPEHWALGDAYPPESDLHYKPVPPPIRPSYQCERCQDARWLVDRSIQQHPQRVKCPDCSFGGME